MKIESIGRTIAILLLLGLAVALVLGSSIISSAQAKNGFTNKSIEGTWGVSGSGTAIGTGPVVSVGRITADGTGVCSLTETLNIAGFGKVSRTSSMCTYSVDPDGTFTSTIVFHPSETSHVAGVIVDKEREFHFILTDINMVVSGFGKKQ